MKKNKSTNPKDSVGSSKTPSSTVSQAVLSEVGVGMMEGAMKYGRHNYRVTSVSANVYYDATRRHLDRWWEGEDLDPDSGVSHITKAICSLVVLRDSMIRGYWVDNRPPKVDPAFFKDLDKRAAELVKKYQDPVAEVTEENKEVWTVDFGKE